MARSLTNRLKSTPVDVLLVAAAGGAVAAYAFSPIAKYASHAGLWVRANVLGDAAAKKALEALAAENAKTGVA